MLQGENKAALKKKPSPASRTAGRHGMMSAKVKGPLATAGLFSSSHPDEPTR
jgi:hypothetical protein